MFVTFEFLRDKIPVDRTKVNGGILYLMYAGIGPT